MEVQFLSAAPKEIRHFNLNNMRGEMRGEGNFEGMVPGEALNDNTRERRDETVENATVLEALESMGEARAKFESDLNMAGLGPDNLDTLASLEGVDKLTGLIGRYTEANADERKAIIKEFESMMG
jgi:hypothetical protein